MNPLMTPAELCALPQAVVLDCRFSLTDPEAGARAYAQGHWPGAYHAHLERHLSGPKHPAGPQRGGRHPLPDRAAFARQVAAWGITPGVPVVAYDADGGMYAARAWWLLRWLGHADVAVLDGGLPAWLAGGGTLATDAPALHEGRAPYPASPAPAMPTRSADELAGHVVVDARAGERFRGDVEPLDRRAGHIPGAINRCFKDNLQADGRFKSAGELLAAFASLGEPGRLVHQCGSGVSACHNLLAMEAAGLPGAALYPGSWSEWSADPARPIATGA